MTTDGPVEEATSGSIPIGLDAYRRAVTLHFARTATGREIWTISREPGGSDDEANALSGLTPANIKSMAAAVRIHETRRPQ